MILKMIKQNSTGIALAGCKIVKITNSKIKRSI